MRAADITVSNNPSAPSCGVYGCECESVKEIDLGYMKFRLCRLHVQDLIAALEGN